MVEREQMETGSNHDPFAMQKVVGSSPIIRSTKGPRNGTSFLPSQRRRTGLDEVAFETGRLSALGGREHGAG
jgi:hypothetical protein